MTICYTCGKSFDWGLVDGKWVPLEPIATHSDLDRTYVDENGVLRADHRDTHGDGAASVNADRLTKKIKAADVAEEEPKHRRRVLRRRNAA